MRICATENCDRPALKQKTRCSSCTSRRYRERRSVLVTCLLCRRSVHVGRSARGRGRTKYCSDACAERANRERTRNERCAEGEGLAPGAPSAWGESVEDWLARKRPAWAREPSPTPDAWARHGDMMDSAAGAP